MCEWGADRYEPYSFLTNTIVKKKADDFYWYLKDKWGNDSTESWKCFHFELDKISENNTHIFNPAFMRTDYDL